MPCQQARPGHRLRPAGADDQLQEEGGGGRQRGPQEVTGQTETDIYLPLIRKQLEKSDTK